MKKEKWEKTIGDFLTMATAGFTGASIKTLMDAPKDSLYHYFLAFITILFICFTMFLVLVAIPKLYLESKNKDED